MKRIFIFVIVFIVSFFSRAQQIIVRDEEIEKMVNEVSPDSLKSYIETLVSFGTRNTLSTTQNQSSGIVSARNWVLKKFLDFGSYSIGRVTAYIDTTTLKPDGQRVDTPTLLGNVVAVLKGTDTIDRRVFIMSAHLDSRRSNVLDRIDDAPGANDDASGCAAVLECARILSRHAFPATVIFVTFSGEEQGLLGAYFMAGKAKKENWQIEAVLNNDIIGSNISNETSIINNTQLRVFSEGLPYYELDKNAKTIRQFGMENDGASRQLARYVKETGERYVDNLQVILIYRNDRFLRGGDHSAFVENGFAAIRITEMNENYTRQHQDLRTENGISYGDIPQHIDYEYLRKNTAVNLSSLSNLAKAPPVPREVKIDVKKLGNTTSLNWLKPAGGKVKGYFILIRETTSAVWQKKFFTDQMNVTLPYSKDNYFFALQSVGEKGNESLPVIPTVSH